MAKKPNAVLPGKLGSARTALLKVRPKQCADAPGAGVRIVPGAGVGTAAFSVFILPRTHRAYRTLHIYKSKLLGLWMQGPCARHMDARTKEKLAFLRF